MARDSEDENLVVDPIRVAEACLDPGHGPFLDPSRATIDGLDRVPSRGHDHGRKRIATVEQARRPRPLLSRWRCLALLAAMRATRRETQCRRSILVGAGCVMRVSMGQGRLPVVGRRDVEAEEKVVVDRDR